MFKLNGKNFVNIIISLYEFTRLLEVSFKEQSEANQSINQPTNQPTNQPINQSINQSILYFSVEHNVTEYNEGCKNTNIKKYINRTSKPTLLQ